MIRPLLPARGLAATLCAVASIGLASIAVGGVVSEPVGATAAAVAAGESLLPAAEGTTDYPLTLTTPWGETVLDERPERVAVIGMSPNLDALQALAVVPVYSVGDDEPWVWRDQAWYEAIEFVDVATRNDPTNFEAIAASQPDLIVATNWIFEQGDYDRLAQIAPVLDNPETVDGDQIEWQATQRLIGEAVDLQAAADETIAAAEEQVDEVAAAHPEFAGKTTTVIYDYGAEWGMSYFTVTGGTAEQVMERLGFAPNPLAEQFVADDNVSEELQTQLDADVLLVFGEDEATVAARQSSELFQLIPAVADGRAAVIVAPWDSVPGHSIWVLRRGASALSLPVAAEQITEWVGLALDEG